MARADERAGLLFAIYVELGPQRSLKLLHERLGSLGAAVSLPTLKRYSIRFDWQGRLDEIASNARDRQTEKAVEHVEGLNDRHLQLARALQGAAGSGLQRLLANDSRLSALKPADIARLLELGLRAERQTLASELDRRQISIAVWNLVLTSITEVFGRANCIEDPAERARQFATEVDTLVQEHLDTLDEAGQ